MGLLRQFPPLVALLLIVSALMLIPAAHAMHLRDWGTARIFLYHAVFFALFGMILGLGTMDPVQRFPAATTS